MSSFKAGKSDVSAPGKKSTLTNGGVFRTESAGVEYGLSQRRALSTEANDPMLDNSKDSMTGNATERVKSKASEKASSKGKSFTIE